jgi:hypothetical protein
MLDSLPTRSQDFEVPIPPDQLRHGGRGLRGDLQQRRSLKAHRGLCSDSVTCRRYVRSRHVPRLDCDVITLSTLESFLHVVILS